MAICNTRFHGAIEFERGQVLNVPSGLFGFPDETQFLLLELPSWRPMVFVQSVLTPNLCFVSLPVQVIDKDYHLSLGVSERQLLGFPAGSEPKMGRDLLCLALLTFNDGQHATANLLAPLVVDIANHRGLQTIVDGEYSHRHPFLAPRLQQAC